jgi:putative peptidoglycan lipid II flippase
MIKTQTQPALFKSITRPPSLLGSTFLLISSAILARIVTILFQIIIAHELGVSQFSDAYFAVEQVPELFLGLVSLGISSLFIPIFTEHRVNHGEEQASRFANSFLFLSTILSLGLAGICVVFAPIFVKVLAPGFQGSIKDLTVSLLQIMAISAIFLGPNAIFRGVLQAHNEFLFPELGRFIYNCILLVIAFTLLRRFGVLTLAWGIVLAGAFMAGIQFLAAYKKRIFKAKIIFDFRTVAPATKKMLPFIIAICGVEILFLTDRIVASTLDQGSVAIINYASRLVLIPVGFFALPFRTALYPTLSQFAAERDLNKIAETALSGLKILFFVAIPSCVALAILCQPLTEILFERGAFDHLATIATSQTILLYTPAVPAIGAIFFIQYIYFSLDAVHTLIKINFFSWAINLLLNLAFIRFLGYGGIALATSLATNITIILAFFLLKRNDLRSFNVNNLLISLCRFAFISGIMGLLILLLAGKVNDLLIQSKMNFNIFYVLIMAIIGTIIFMITAKLMRTKELAILMRGFQNVWRGKKLL